VGYTEGLAAMEERERGLGWCIRSCFNDCRLSRALICCLQFHIIISLHGERTARLRLRMLLAELDAGMSLLGQSSCFCICLQAQFSSRFSEVDFTYSSLVHY
jgi:hypothetical protein